MVVVKRSYKGVDIFKEDYTRAKERKNFKNKIKEQQYLKDTRLRESRKG